jgi:hypothetical protein
MIINSASLVLTVHLYFFFWFCLQVSKEEKREIRKKERKKERRRDVVH